MSPRQPLDIPGLLGILFGAFIIAAGLNDPFDSKYCADCRGGLIYVVLGTAYSYFGPWGARAILIAAGVILIATSWRSRWNPDALAKRPPELASLHSHRLGRALVLMALLLLLSPGVVAAYQLAKGEPLLGFAIGVPWLVVYVAVCVFNQRRGGLRLRTSLGGAALLVGGVGLLTAFGAVAQERALPCASDDKECARAALRVSPTKKLEFWTQALARPIEQRIGAGPPELVVHLALDNIASGFPNKPRSARLSADFLADVHAAFAELPEAVKRQAAAKLAGIYFIEDIGGTGFTDQAYGPDGKPKVGFIILDPLVLATQTANGWATWKENTPFKPDPTMKLEARIESGADDNRKNAIQYILLHELGHVLSVGESFHPNWNLSPKNVASTSEFAFFELSWKVDRREGRYLSLFDDAFPQRRNVVYYFGAKLQASEMIPAYERLEATNFSTLYAVTQPGDDFAEAFASYVHAVMMKKPFEIRILRDGKLAKTYGSCWALERCAAKRRILERFLDAR